MTDEEFDNICIWDILKDSSTGQSMVVVGKDDRTVTASFIGGLTMVIPRDMNGIVRTGMRYTPDYNVINHMIELYKRYAEEKPNGIFLSSYIKNNWYR